MISATCLMGSVRAMRSGMMAGRYEMGLPSTFGSRGNGFEAEIRPRGPKSREFVDDSHQRATIDVAFAPSVDTGDHILTESGLVIMEP